MSNLGDRIKKYELEFTAHKIDPSLPFVIRLDGHSFSKFTRGLKKPYDYDFHQAFVDVTKKLMKMFQADLGYTHSDEISLLFYPKRTKDDSSWRIPMYAGKIQKVVSISAAYCTMLFNQHLASIFKDKEAEYLDTVYTRLTGSNAYFDSRIFQLPNDVEMFSYLFWRSKIDCRRNHISELCRCYFTKSELYKVTTNERVKMLLDKGVDWDKEPACFRRGSFFKQKSTRVDDTDSIRTSIVEVDIELTKFSDEINSILKSEYL